jgi:hypothetical protein
MVSGKLPISSLIQTFAFSTQPWAAKGMHLVVVHPVLQLHLEISVSFGGAGGRSVCTMSNIPMLIFDLHSSGFNCPTFPFHSWSWKFTLRLRAKNTKWRRVLCIRSFLFTGNTSWINKSIPCAHTALPKSLYNFHVSNSPYIPLLSFSSLRLTVFWSSSKLFLQKTHLSIFIYS